MVAAQAADLLLVVVASACLLNWLPVAESSVDLVAERSAESPAEIPSAL